jgi:ubiquinone biosynthesis protein
MLGTSLNARHLGRYKDIAFLMSEFSRAGTTSHGTLAEDPAAPRDGAPEELAAALERLGPTFIKLGQLLSTRPDLLSEAHMTALARLQDRVRPFPFEEAQRILHDELGVRVNKMFREIDPRPVAAASLAQIHRAVLRDGSVVAVKILRPDIRRIVAEDLAAIEEAARFMDRHTKVGRRYEFTRILDEFRKSVERELDFAQEAENLRTLSANLREFDLLVVPAPHEDFSTTRVLTMDFVEGRKITDLSPLALNELDGRALADQLFRAYLKQILVDGFFHADPHPGNVVLNAEGRIAILDLGMVERLAPHLQQQLLALLLAVSEGRSDDAAEVAIKIGSKRDEFDEERLRRKVSDLVLSNRDSTIAQLNLGRIVMEIARFSSACGLRLPQEMTMIGKALMNLDRVVETLDPDFEPAAVVRAETSKLYGERVRRTLSLGAMTAGALQAQEFAEMLPERLSKALDVLGGNELRVKVDAVDEHLLIHGMQKIANRIALGLVLASLIIGAALLMQVETRFKILGYPGLVIILFLGAAVASLVLIVDILYYDENRKLRLRRGKIRPE